MLKKTIKYEDYNGVEREDDCYFHISKTELSKLQLSTEGGLDTKLARIIQSKSTPDLLKLYAELIHLSYGVKSDDGKYFRKSEEAFADFQASPAYDVLFMELINDPHKMIAFIKGVFPAEITAHLDDDGELTKLMAAADANK